MKLFNIFLFYLLMINFLFGSLYSFSVETNSYTDNEYYFKIEVPKINLNEKVYNYKNDKNDVNKGIYLATDYNFSSKDKSIVLASHSGNSKISHFKNLDKLTNGDEIIIDYQNNIYVYKTIDIYNIEKNGSFKYKDDSNLIYLITCDKKDDKKQLVFKGKMEKIIEKSKKI